MSTVFFHAQYSRHLLLSLPTHTVQKHVYAESGSRTLRLLQDD